MSRCWREGLATMAKTSNKNPDKYPPREWAQTGAEQAEQRPFRRYPGNLADAL
jgi:hypothetical protein